MKLLILLVPSLSVHTQNSLCEYYPSWLRKFSFWVFLVTEVGKLKKHFCIVTTNFPAVFADTTFPPERRIGLHHIQKVYSEEFKQLGIPMHVYSFLADLN